MSDVIIIPENAGKQEKYESLIPQIRALIEGESDAIANVANLIAALKYSLGYFWVGLYRVQENSGKEELVLGPFQGPVACTRISIGRGVCGKSWEEKRTIIVEDVDLFPGHIVCSSLSRSEIVVPVIKNGKVIGVIDVDSDRVADFDEIDAKYLEVISKIMAGIL